MKMHHRPLVLLLCCLALAAASPAFAQNFPAKMIKIIVPYSPGGTTDLLARLVAQKLQQAWGQPVVVENRPGANGIVGSDLVAKAPPDGYTLSIASVGTHAANASLYPSLPHDIVTDFAPITLAVAAPMLFVVHPSLQVTTLKEFIVLAQAKPGQIPYASGGSGSSQHLAMELFNLMAKIETIHVPYKGSAASYTDLLGGTVVAEIDVMPTSLPHVQSGKLRGLAVASSKRLPHIPNIPTIAEAGVPGYEFDAWYGIVTRGGTPKPIVDKLHGEIVKALNSPDVKERLTNAGVVVVASTPEYFAQFIKSEMQKMERVIRTANIKID
jgi:tripartite-type tricarboxylate transporter receptor subunit TctC